MSLVTEGDVSDLGAAEFARLATEAEKKCPVSNLLRNGLAISLETSLKQLGHRSSPPVLASPFLDSLSGAPRGSCRGCVFCARRPPFV